MSNIGRLRGYALIVRASRKFKSVNVLIDVAFEDDGRIVPVYEFFS